jgi:hypothetical protein
MKDRTTEKLIYFIKCMAWPNDVMTNLITDVLSRPLTKTIMTVFTSTMYLCKYLHSQQIKALIIHIVEGLETLPDKKYGYLNKIMELLSDLEEMDTKMS